MLQNEACGMALHLVRGIMRRDDIMAFDVLKEGLKEGHFLSLDHTRKWARAEFFFPGPTIDRMEGIKWQKEDGLNATERAHGEVKSILSKAEPPPLGDDVVRELESLCSLH
jgi:trimethylamine:corrinoid methyltransferase-like protein